MKWWGLLFGLIMGGLFDITQQLRGAHFASHGIWTLGIIWFISTGLYLLICHWRLARERTAKFVIEM